MYLIDLPVNLSHADYSLEKILIELLPGWHPLIVHFAIGLLLPATAALCASRLVRAPQRARTLATVGTWNLIAGAIAALLAVGTGLAAVFSYSNLPPATAHAVSMHFFWGCAAMSIFAVLAVGRIAGIKAEALPSTIYVVILLLAAMLLCVTGYLGGENVYRYGVGVLSQP
jgi:uncharacterized membrane protein